MLEKSSYKAISLLILAGLIIFSCPTFAEDTYKPTKVAVDYDASKVEGTVYPGDTGILNLVIKNVGELDAENVKLEIAGTNDISASGTWQIGTLSSEESYSVSTKFSVQEDAKVGVHTITVRTYYDGYGRYKKEDNNQRDTFEFNLRVSGNTLFIMDEASSSKKTLEPGDSFSLDVNFKNQGNAKAQAVSAEINPGRNIGILGSGKKYLGTVDSGSTASATYDLHLNEELSPGAYDLPITVTYEDALHDEMTQKLSAGIRVIGKVNVSTSVKETDPQEVHPGDEEIEVSVEIDNTGTKKLNNVRLELVPQRPFSNSKSFKQEKSIGSLSSSDSKEVSFYLDLYENASQSTSNQLLKLTYRSGNEIHEIEKTMPITIMDYPDIKVESKELIGAAGTLNELRATVKNTGSECNSVTLWALKKSGQPFEFEDKSYFIGDLEEGDSAEAVMGFTVDEDAVESDHMLPVEARCTVSGDVITFTDTVKIQTQASSASILSNPLYIVAALAILVLIGGYIVRSQMKE